MQSGFAFFTSNSEIRIAIRTNPNPSPEFRRRCTSRALFDGFADADVENFRLGPRRRYVTEG
jgi:hypothetical protein